MLPKSDMKWRKAAKVIYSQNNYTSVRELFPDWDKLECSLVYKLDFDDKVRPAFSTAIFHLLCKTFPSKACLIAGGKIVDSSCLNVCLCLLQIFLQFGKMMLCVCCVCKTSPCMLYICVLHLLVCLIGTPVYLF